jgi:hypothetical protein
LITAVLDYNIDYKIRPMIDIYDGSTMLKDPKIHWNLLKDLAFDYWAQNKLDKLKEMFASVTQDYISNLDFVFREYLSKSTEYKIDILKNYFRRMDKIIEKGEISTQLQCWAAANFIRALKLQGINDTRNKKLERLVKKYYSKRDKSYLKSD